MLFRDLIEALQRDRLVALVDRRLRDLRRTTRDLTLRDFNRDFRHHHRGRAAGLAGHHVARARHEAEHHRRRCEGEGEGDLHGDEQPLLLSAGNGESLHRCGRTGLLDIP